MMTYREIKQAEEMLFDAFTMQHPHASLWQSSAWKEYEERCGRTVRRFAGWRDNTMCMVAQVSIDRTIMHVATWTVQRGPLWNTSVVVDDIACFLAFLQNEATKDGAMSLFLSPASWHPLVALPGKKSLQHIVPQATVMIDLMQPEEDILKAMHQKGRYNIHVAQRNGVLIEESDDIDGFYALLQSTGGRDGFRIKRKSDYEAFLKMPGSFLLLATAASCETRATSSSNESSKLEARSSKKPIAGLLGIIWDTKAIYYYGASDYAFRSLMAPYLLQWAAIQRAKATGCVSYDLLGISPPDAPKHDPWQGISDFKRKFGGDIIEYPPEREIVLRPAARMIVRMKRKIVG